MSCIFCKYFKDGKYIIENDLAFAVYDKFPVNKGHTLIVPKRHFSSFFDATTFEVIAIFNLINDIKKIIDKDHKPSGYNIGINIGEDSGQTIFHLHVHVIPRYKGDIENPRGGIRNFKKPLVEYNVNL